MSSIKKVAVAGASGSLGVPLVKELVKSGFSVSALTRPDSESTFPSGVEVIKVDYNDVPNLTEALQGQDAVVSTITTIGIESQRNLIDAAVAAKVKRFIPSEFGCDVSNPKARQLPVYGKKVQIQEVLEQKTKGTVTTYTYVYNNAFLDWGIDMKFLIDIKNKKMDLYDDGNQPFTTTPLATVAKAVAGVLKKPEETKNTHVRVHGAKITQNQFLKLAKKVVGEDGWTIKQVSTEDAERQAYENLKKDPSAFMAWAFPMLQVANYRPGYGGDFSLDNDNERLGVRALSESEVEEVIRERA